MSEQLFKESKSNLAFSQQLVDKMRQQKQMDMGQEMGMDEPLEEVITPQEEVVEEPVEEVTSEPEEKNEAGMLSAFMDEVRALFKGKEDEEKKTQELTEKYTKDIEEVKGTLKDILNEDDK